MGPLLKPVEESSKAFISFSLLAALHKASKEELVIMMPLHEDTVPSFRGREPPY